MLCSQCFYNNGNACINHTWLVPGEVDPYGMKIDDLRKFEDCAGFRPEFILLRDDIE